MATKIAIQLLRGNIAFKDINDIIYIKTKDSICYVYLRNKEVLKSNQPLTHFKQLFQDDSSFFIFNRSLIINLNHIKYFNNIDQEIILDENSIISISRRGASKFKEYINSIEYKIE